MDLLNVSASPGGTRKPFSPSLIISASPAIREAMTGRPIDIASITTIPNVSGQTEGSIEKLLRRYASITAVCGQLPITITFLGKFEGVSGRGRPIKTSGGALFNFA